MKFESPDFETCAFFRSINGCDQTEWKSAYQFVTNTIKEAMKSNYFNVFTKESTNLSRVQDKSWLTTLICLAYQFEWNVNVISAFLLIDIGRSGVPGLQIRLIQYLFSSGGSVHHCFNSFNSRLVFQGIHSLTWKLKPKISSSKELMIVVDRIILSV